MAPAFDFSPKAIFQGARLLIFFPHQYPPCPNPALVLQFTFVSDSCPGANIYFDRSSAGSVTPDTFSNRHPSPSCRVGLPCKNEVYSLCCSDSPHLFDLFRLCQAQYRLCFQVRPFYSLCTMAASSFVLPILHYRMLISDFLHCRPTLTCLHSQSDL